MFNMLSDRFKRIFERPTPIIYCGTESIELVSPPSFIDGYFIVKNTGGGNLEGDIFAQSSCINLLTQTVEGNDVIIEYEIDVNHLSPGDVFTSRIVLTTSGGQFIIPVSVTIEPYYIMCGEQKLYHLTDYSKCVRIMPMEMSLLFVTREFEQWLINSKCKHIELYHKMTEKEVGLKEIDCFLAVCGAKQRAGIMVNDDNIEIRVSADYGIKECTMDLTSTDWGHFEYKVYTHQGAPWLILSQNMIDNNCFDNNKYTYNYMVDEKLLGSSKCHETIIFDNNYDTVAIDVTVTREKLFTVRPSRLSYKSEDSGYLVCSNNTGKNALVEVSTSEKFIKFKAEKYVVEGVSEIPFEIKVSSFLNLVIGKKPINTSNVSVRTVIDGIVYKETVTIKAGSLLNV